MENLSLFFYIYIYNNSMYYDLFFVNKFYPSLFKNIREKISRGTKEL